jgi:hypothetical protein
VVEIVGQTRDSCDAETNEQFVDLSHYADADWLLMDRE